MSGPGSASGHINVIHSALSKDRKFWAKWRGNSLSHEDQTMVIAQSLGAGSRIGRSTRRVTQKVLHRRQSPVKSVEVQPMRCQ